LARPVPFKIESDKKYKINIKSVKFNEETKPKNIKKNKKYLQFRSIDQQYKKIYQNNAIIYIPKKN